ncbi:MAG: TRAP transporter large permease [Halorhabdus sp.]
MVVETSLLLAGVVIVVLLAIGVPVFAAIGVGTILFLNTDPTLAPGIITDGLFSGLDSFPLLAVPLFIFTGDAVAEGGIAEDLLDFAESVVGGLRSGIGSATILGCGFFATISGSSSSDAAAIGRMTLPRLQKIGYTRSYASAMIASGASTGVLIPPSITYVIAGVTLGLPASTLFKVAFIPGTLILLGMLAANIVVNRRRDYENSARTRSIREILVSANEAKLGIAIPVIILGGIYGGVFTPTEAAAVAVAVALVFGGYLGTIEFSDYPKMLERSALVNAMVAPIIGVGVVMSQVFALIGLPDLIASAITAFSGNFYVVTFLMIVTFLLAGTIMDITPNVIILGPLFAPIASDLGINPFHFAIFFMTTLAVGFITPPVGLNLYVMSGISDEPVIDIGRDAVPFMLSMLFIVLLLAWVPSLYMWVL